MTNAPKTATELRDAFITRHLQADTSCCSDGEPVSGKLVHIGMFGDFPCRAGREREREASNTADLDALLSAARTEAIAELRAGVDVEACARAGYESDPGWRYQWDGINMYATTRDAHIRIARAVLRAAKVLP